MVSESSSAESAQQYFPTYKIPNDPEIVLREYDLSAQGLAADQNAISIAAGLLVLVSGGITTLLASELDPDAIDRLEQSLTPQVELLAYFTAIALALITTRYLVELRKNATHGARKIIILRRLLGVDYGTIERVLPSDRLEGAHEPFAIPLFPGWWATVSLAALTVAGVTGYACLGFAISVVEKPSSLTSELSAFLGMPSSVFPYAVGLFATSVVAFSYRRMLFETWETLRYFLARAVGRFLGVPLKTRMGHVLYRMELSVIEAKRLGTDLDRMFPLLLRIEDREFFRHGGNSVKAVFGAFYRYVKFGAKGGASTIAQQLCRSNFLSKIPRDVRRKAIEWALAPWIMARYSRQEILRLYLCSVRFAYRVEGVPQALRHFFNAPLDGIFPWTPNTAQTFFLIERLSNVSGTLPVKRIAALIADAMNENLLNEDDRLEIIQIYKDQVRNGRLIDPGVPLDFAFGSSQPETAGEC